MAKDVPVPESNYKGDLIVQRRKALAAIRANRVQVGPHKYRSLTPRERAAYQRVVHRADKVVGPIPKRKGEGGVEGLVSGWRVLRGFLEHLRAAKEEFDKLPEKTKRIAEER